ncbi:MAG: CBS domain-containing protein [Candidatus Micrarchaeota archaeon]|nr:CBS domain-containing protein [Candidatus Micrarchaeota archaeon]
MVVMHYVNAVMQTHIVGVAKSAKLGAAAKLMERSAVSLLPVIYGSRLIGTITKKEIERAHSSGKSVEKTTVEMVMKDDFYFVVSGAHIDEAAKIMIKRNLTRIPVVNNLEEMHCVGMISSTEVLDAKNRVRKR